MFWLLLIVILLPVALVAVALWYSGHTIQDVVRQPPKEMDLPEFVTILGYLHHELIKHRLPLVRTVVDRPLEEVQPADVDLLKQVLTGKAERPSVVAELEGYLSGLRRAAGTVRLNFWRDPLVRRTRWACRVIQSVADGLGGRVALTRSEHARLRKADEVLDGWFRPRLQALRNSVLILKLEPELFREPVERVRQELGLEQVEVELPELDPDDPIHVRMLRHDFDLALRNLVRNALQSAQSQGSTPRVAIEVATRLEMTGEESVLVRIYDTHPEVLSRDKLYGGQLGRGLNLVTTTLRRYDGSLGCVASSREPFAKFMEVRLFRELSDVRAAALLDERDPLAQVFPVSVGLATAALLGVASAGLLGMVPDPTGGALEQVLRLKPPDTPVPAPLTPEQLKLLAEAREEASAGLHRAVEEASAEAERLRSLGAAPAIPTPSEILTSRRRCAPKVYEDRLEMDCRLVGLDHRLETPAVVVGFDSGVDVSRLEVEVEEFVPRGTDGLIRTDERCVRTYALKPGERLPKGYPEGFGDDLAEGTSRRKKRPPSRLLVDYKECLKEPRYPLELRVRFGHNDDDAKLPVPKGPKSTTVALRVKLDKREDARASYAKIAHRDKVLKAPERRRFVRHMARYMADSFEADLKAGALRRDNEDDLAQALYYGWVRPGLYRLLEERAQFDRRGGKNPPKTACKHHAEVEEGLRRMQAIDAKAARIDQFRSEYYAIHALLWQYNAVDQALERFDGFQRRLGRASDFAQGARLYGALLLTLGEAPEAKHDGVAGAILTPDDGTKSEAEVRLERAVKLLRQLMASARRPPTRDNELVYERIKLIGIRSIFQDGGMDESLRVNHVICGFYDVQRAWVDAMSRNDREALFGQCANYQPDAQPSLMDPLRDNDDDDDADAGVGERDAAPVVEPPDVETSPQVDVAARYIDGLLRLIRDGAPLCREPVPPSPAEP